MITFSKEKMRLLNLIVATITFTLLISGCSHSIRTNHDLVNRIKNRGPLALSTDNPYLVANLFLAEEAKSNETLKGFISHRGAPPVIELQGDIFNNLNMKLFYPETREYFLADDETGYWIVNGPYRIPDSEAELINEIAKDVKKEPVLVSHDDPQTTSELAKSPPIARLPTDLKPMDPKADPFLGQSKIEPTGTVKPEPAVNTPKMSVSKTVELEKIRSRYASRPAELTPKGDIVHYVNSADESLRMIAEWYTDDPDNAQRLARINRLSGRVRLGDMIIIPSYLVTFKGRMPEEAVKFFNSN